MNNVEAVRAIIELGFNQGQLDFVDDISAEKVIEHEYLAPHDLSGSEAIRSAIIEIRNAVVQLSLTIEDLVEQDDKVWTRCFCTGIEATTGKAFTMYVMDTFRFEHGKLVEHWGVPDRFAMLHQVGLLSLAPSETAS